MLYNVSKLMHSNFVWNRSVASDCKHFIANFVIICSLRATTWQHTQDSDIFMIVTLSIAKASQFSNRTYAANILN